MCVCVRCGSAPDGLEGPPDGRVSSPDRRDDKFHLKLSRKFSPTKQDRRLAKIRLPMRVEPHGFGG